MEKKFIVYDFDNGHEHMVMTTNSKESALSYADSLKESGKRFLVYEAKLIEHG